MQKLTTNEIEDLKKLKPIDKLIRIIKILRDPVRGCPWDLRQNYDTLSNFPIEEAYELQEAILNKNIDNIKEELGDLLLQVVLFSQIGEEKKDFSFEDVVDAISNKLIIRHPQIFDKKYKKNDKPEDTWEQIKQNNKVNSLRNNFISLLDDIPKNLPSMQKSIKLQKKAKLLNFDWNNYQEVFVKVFEELKELQIELERGNNTENIEEEIGDLIFTIVNLSRHLNSNPEVALEKANKKFKNRFTYLEKKIYNKKLDFKDKNVLENIWREAKVKLRGHNE